MANSYLSSNTGTATNAKKFTYSVWLKRSKISSEQRFYQGYKDSNNRAYAVFLSSDKLRSSFNWSDEIDLDLGLEDTLLWINQNLGILKNLPWNYEHKV